MSDYFNFPMLGYVQQCEKLWKNTNGPQKKKIREWLFFDIGFGKYMKWLRNKNKYDIILVMEDVKMKEEDND